MEAGQRVRIGAEMVNALFPLESAVGGHAGGQRLLSRHWRDGTREKARKHRRWDTGKGFCREPDVYPARNGQDPLRIQKNAQRQFEQEKWRWEITVKIPVRKEVMDVSRAIKCDGAEP
jgi:hypothetical protein